MDIRKTLALLGPNVWGCVPILEVWVDCQRWSQLSSDDLAKVAQRALALAAPYLAAEDFDVARQDGSPAELVLSRWLEALTRKLRG